MPSMAAFGSNESCPNCNARMAADQRYCLNCGHRRGEPRLPFMDAVVFMESMNSAPGGAGGATPPPPPAQSGGSNNKWNANAALIAGVATLVLAIGVGFLIGRTGHNDNSSAGAGKVQVVQVPATSGTVGETPITPEAESPTAEGGGKGSTAPKAKGKTNGKSAAEKTTSEKSNIKEDSKEEEELAKEATKEALHTKEGIKIESKVEVGGKCEQGAAGCSKSGEFTGNFFGE
jgi:hypothetical protein